MKPALVVAISLAILAGGCTDRNAEERRARDEAEARARAEATLKEMEAAPKAFQSRDYFKKNEPEDTSPRTPTAPNPNP